MRSFLLLCVFCSLLSCFALPGRAEGTDYFAPANILAFANYLFQEKDYLHAAGEYQRYLIEQPLASPEEKNATVLKIGQCERLSGEYDKAITTLRQITGGPSLEQACYEMALAYYQWGRYTESLQCLATHSVTDPGLRAHTTLLRAVDEMSLHQWRSARATLAADPAPNEDSADLAKVAGQGVKLHKKSPALAAILSAIVPGAGKLYIGQSLDGLSSFVTVGTLAYETYYNYHRGHQSAGLIYGSIASLFYLGNIYGSYVEVRVDNAQKENNLLSKMRLCVSFPL